MAAVSSSSANVLHRFLRPTPPQPPFLFSLTPHSITTSIAASITRKCILLCKYPKLLLHNTTASIASESATASTYFSFQYPPFTATSHSLLLPQTFCTSSLNHSLPLEEEEEEEEEVDGEIEYEKEEMDIDIDTESEKLELEDATVFGKEESKRSGLKVPNLTVKEKKELASYAHGLGKKLKSQLVGKSGVTDNVVSSFIETLEANELLKIKIHRTCPGELDDVVQKLEEATGSVVVAHIGRTVIIYRPSVSKMEAEEKRRREHRVFVRKDSRLKPVSLLRGQVPRLSDRGRRGSSRI